MTTTIQITITHVDYQPRRITESGFVYPHNDENHIPTYTDNDGNVRNRQKATQQCQNCGSIYCCPCG